MADASRRRARQRSLKDATAKALTAAKALGGDGACAGRRQRTARPAAEAAAKLDGVAKVLLADAPPMTHMLAEPTGGADRRARRRLRRASSRRRPRPARTSCRASPRCST